MNQTSQLRGREHLEQIVAVVLRRDGDAFDPVQQRSSLLASPDALTEEAREVLATDEAFADFVAEVREQFASGPDDLSVRGPGSLVAEGIDSLLTLPARAVRGGMRREAAEAAESSLDQLEIVYCLYRWTVLFGTPPSEEDWNRETAVEDGWPSAERVEQAFGSFEAMLVAADFDASAFEERFAEVRQRAHEAERIVRQARDAEEEARRTLGDARKRDAQQAELKRQLENAKRKSEEEREQRRQGERAVREAQSQAADAATELARAREEAAEAREGQRQAVAEAAAARKAAERGLPPKLPAPGLEGEGRSLYAVWLSFASGVIAHDLIAEAAAWIDSGSGANQEELTGAGKRVLLDLEESGSSVEVASYRDDGRGELLWEAAWRRPFANQLNLFIVAEITVAEVNGQVHGGLVLRLVRPAARLDKVSFDLRPPRLTRTWVERFEVIDAGRQLGVQPELLSERELAGLAALISHHERRRPVVLTRQPADPLAVDLAGLAHVLQLGDEGAERICQALDLRSLSSQDPLAAVVWPGAVPPLAPRDVSIVTARNARNDVPSALAERACRLVHNAAVIGLPTPVAVEELRRRAARARLTAEVARPAPEEPEAVDDEFFEDYQRTVDENEQLRTRLQEAHQRNDDLQRMLDDEQRRQRAADWGQAAVEEELEPESDGGEPGSHFTAVRERLDRLPECQSVGEAVAAAHDLCPNLTFAENAATSAADSPYRDPRKLLGDLVLLDRVAEMYLRGDIGTSLFAIAQELNLSWVEDSSAADHGATARHYKFSHAGREWVLRPHVRVGGRAAGDGNIARIYFSLHEGDEQLDRAVIVGHVGRKLPDSTT